MSDLQKAWDERCKLWGDGDKLLAKSDNLRTESDKLWDEGCKLQSEGGLIFLNAVINKYGVEAAIKYTEASVIVNGQEFIYKTGGKDE